MLKKVSDFFFDYYEKNNIPNIYREVFYPQENKSVQNKYYNKEKNLATMNSVMFIPSYTVPKVDNVLFRTITINQFFKGYAIELERFKSVDEYLKDRFKKNSKSILKKVKRLEHCFSISYQFYFGEISKSDYDFFMNNLKKMIVKRFQQRGDTSQNLHNWDHYYEIFFNLINEKKASLFVIIKDEHPICISISNHNEGKLFSSVSSYDIDYSKFSLGSIEIYKKLEWCLANSHNSYEFGMGDLSYKREWSNKIYNFKHHIIYPKKSINAAVLAFIEFIKVSIKEGIYKLIYVRYKKWKNKKKNVIPFCSNYMIQNVQKTISNDNLHKIDYKLDQYGHLRKPIYDFLYYNIENQQNVCAYELLNEKKTYLISGKTNQQKIVFN